MGVQSLGPRARRNAVFLMAFPCHPVPARYIADRHRNNIQDPLQRRPEEKTSTWFAVVASQVRKIDPLWA